MKIGTLDSHKTLKQPRVWRSETKGIFKKPVSLLEETSLQTTGECNNLQLAPWLFDLMLS